MSELRTMPFMVSSDNTLKVQCSVPYFKILLSNIYTIITTLYIYTILYYYIIYFYIYIYIFIYIEEPIKNIQTFYTAYIINYLSFVLVH